MVGMWEGWVDFMPWRKTDRPTWKFVHISVLAFLAPRPIETNGLGSIADVLHWKAA